MVERDTRVVGGTSEYKFQGVELRYTRLVMNMGIWSGYG